LSKLIFPMITRIHVKNYRSLADVTIDLEPLTILVGPNGSGKSNAVDVLRFLRDILTRGLDAAIMDRHGMSALRRWSPKGKPYDIHIGLSFVGEDFQGEYSFTLGSESRGEYRVKSEVLTINASKGKAIKYEIKNGEWIKPSKSTTRNAKFLPPVDQVDLQLLRSVRLLEPAASSRFVSSPYRLFSNMGFYTIFPNNLREPQKSANPYPLEEGGQNMASVLRNIKSKKTENLFRRIVEALSKVIPGLEDILVSQVGGYYVTRLLYKANVKGDRRPTFELSQESDGTLRMLGILTALYQIPARTLLTIEEPELTIHPGALGVLCDVINEASMRNQVIITTHSPDLVSQFPANVFRVVEKINGITHIGSISENQRRAINEKLFSPGDLMRIEGFRRD
jgi:predicted ATPase